MTRPVPGRRGTDGAGASGTAGAAPVAHAARAPGDSPPAAEAATAVGADAVRAAVRKPAPEGAVLDADGNWHAEDSAVDLSVYRWEDWVALAVFWLLAFDVFYQFFTRYVLSDSAAWTEEIARYLLIVVTFVGSSMGVRRNTHIQVEFVYRYLPKAVGRAMSTMVDVVRIAMLGYATWLAIDLVPRMHNLQMTVIDWPMSYVYAFVAIGLALMTFRSVQVALTHLKQGWSVLERPESAF
ncbi:MAG: TRAP transporter small permease [Lautropia sp.]